jgi:hypothetical protein
MFKISVTLKYSNIRYPERLDNGYCKYPKHVAHSPDMYYMTVMLLSNNVYLLNCKYSCVFGIAFPHLTEW